MNGCARTNWPAALTTCCWLLLAGCAATVEEPASLPHDPALSWPAPPSAPRLAYVMSFTGAEDLGIRKPLLQRLRVLIGGPEPERLVRPMAITESTGDRFFVADPGVRGVHVFDLDRARYQLVRGQDGEPLPSPVGLASGAGGEVYVTDSRLAALFVIEPGGNAARKVSLDALLSQPTGIAVHRASGRIYVADTGSHEIKVFASDGALLQRIGERGTGPGRFNFPTMIWINGAGELLVSDTLNFRTQVFDVDGRFLKQFGDSAGHQRQSKGVATDSRGHVYVVDSMLHAVQVFDSDGMFLYRLGLLGDSAGEFRLPAGIFIDEQDTIYVTDSYNARIQVFRYVGGDAQ